jgi:hypothetical protein
MAEEPYQIAWVKQASSGGGMAVAVDGSGDIYMSGSAPGVDGQDAVVTKLDPSGNTLWTGLSGATDSDGSRAVAVDATGNVYTAGWAEDASHESNASLTKFDSSGNALWTAQVGWAGTDEESRDVAVDVAGNIYITGHAPSSDPYAYNDWEQFLTKFDSSGNEVWTKLTDTPGLKASQALATDAAGNVYTAGSYDFWDGEYVNENYAYLTKFDSDGNEIWSSRPNLPQARYAFSVAVGPAGNTYVSGWAASDPDGPNSGQREAFVSNIDPDGNEIWATQLATTGTEESYGLAVDAYGNAYIAGVAMDDLHMGPPYDTVEAFVSKLGSDGNTLWTKYIGSDKLDTAMAIAVDACGNAYVTGITEGDFGGPNAGGTEWFLAKLSAAGDFDGDGHVNAADIDILADAIAAGLTDSRYDINGDSAVDAQDLISHIATLVERTDGGIGAYRGDFNLDGFVDATDLAVLKANFGSADGLGFASGNCNTDDLIDATDLAILKATFGFSGTPGDGANPPAIPEPTTLSLLALGAVAILRRRR